MVIEDGLLEEIMNWLNWLCFYIVLGVENNYIIRKFDLVRDLEDFDLIIKIVVKFFIGLFFL